VRREEKSGHPRSSQITGIRHEKVQVQCRNSLSVVRERQVMGEIGPDTARAKVIELAVDEGTSLGPSLRGTEHLLLGLIRKVKVLPPAFWKP